jgi:hypothetical protein
MIWQNYKLGNAVSKTPEDITLWKTERGIIEISNDTLVIPIKLDDEERGCVFHGHGKLLLDAIVETEEGAIGKPVEKELNEPFLMLAGTEEIRKHIVEASEEDLAKIGYKNKQGFVDRAEDLCDQFFKNRVHSHRRFNGDHGLIFAFPNEDSKFDILLAKGSKLVYKATDIVFVSNKNKVVLKNPDEVVCTGNGKSIVIKKGKSVIIRK